MKKILSPLLLIIITTLFLLPEVKADTKTVRYDSTDYSFVNSSGFTSLINSQSSSTGAFFIIQRYSDSAYLLLKTSDITTTSLSCSAPNFVECYTSGSLSNSPRYIINSDYSLTSTSNYSYSMLLLDTTGSNVGTFQLIYSSIPIINLTGNNSLIITDDTNSTTCNPSDTCNLLPYYEFYKNFYGDNTPLLTSFVNLSIEKLSLICDFLTSSYIYLSIFVIFILYFVILFFRRLN